MECYTNSNLPKIVEIIQMPVRDYDVSFVLYPLKTGGCLLLIVVVSMTSPTNKIKPSDTCAIHVQSHVVGFRHFQFMARAPVKSLREQMCTQQYKVANNDM